MTAPVLEIDRLTLAFGGVKALTDISFDVRAHEIRTGAEDLADLDERRPEFLQGPPEALAPAQAQLASEIRLQAPAIAARMPASSRIICTPTLDPSQSGFITIGKGMVTSAGPAPASVRI